MTLEDGCYSNIWYKVLWSEIMELGRKKRTKKDNIRLCQVDFQTRFLHPKVCNYEGMDKLKVGWGLRARKYEEKN